jgi:hypothetical protein
MIDPAVRPIAKSTGDTSDQVLAKYNLPEALPFRPQAFQTRLPSAPTIRLV